MSVYPSPGIQSVFNPINFSGSASLNTLVSNSSYIGTNPRVNIQESYIRNNKQYSVANYLAISDTAYTTAKSLCPLLTGGQFVYLPTSGVTVKMSSSSASDVGQIFLVAGYDSTMTNVVTDLVVLNGQTAVSGLLGTLFSRIIGSQIISNGSLTTVGSPGAATFGNIYLVQGGYSLFTAGVPNDLTQCFCTGLAGTGTLFSSVLSFPNGVNTYFSDLVLNCYNVISNATEVVFTFYARNLTLSESNTKPWKLLVSEMVSSNFPQSYLHQEGFSSISVATAANQFSEIQVCCQRIGGNNNTARSLVNLTGVQVKPV